MEVYCDNVLSDIHLDDTLGNTMGYRDKEPSQMAKHPLQLLIHSVESTVNSYSHQYLEEKWLPLG